MTPSTILTQAAELISKPGAWTQRVAVADRYGVPVGYAEGKCFCLFGAVRSFAPDDDEIFDAAWSFVTTAISPNLPVYWNDAPNRTQAEVVAALRLAADLAREAGE